MDAALKAQIQEQLNQAGYSRAQGFEKLAGDASNREYWRLHLAGHPSSMILMINHQAEGFHSEEYLGGGKAGELKRSSFVEVAEFWRKQGVRVPELYVCDARERFLLLEDLGDCLLFEQRQKDSSLEWYREALRELLRIQALPSHEPVYGRQFGSSILRWECEHFLDYMLLKRQKELKRSELDLLRKFFNEIVQCMEAVPQTVVHRDYHSKNLLLLSAEKRVGVIDFQDALLGPQTYDLASLLRDSYVVLSESEERELYRFYEKESELSLKWEDYVMTSIQRNLKAAGRFYYIWIEKGAKTHLPFVAPTMQRIYRSLEDLNRQAELEILKRYLGDHACD